jgi:molybdenum cofactor synthesis domain-containing protein
MVPPRPLLTAELLSVGTELTVGETRDTNAGELARSLTGMGVAVRRIQALPDDLDAVREAFATALERADLVVSTGGLGPTPDDLTREAIAAVTGEEPAVDADLEAWLRGPVVATRDRHAGDEPQAGLADPIGGGAAERQRDGAGLVGRPTRREGHRRAARPAAGDAPDLAVGGAAAAPGPRRRR